MWWRTQQGLRSARGCSHGCGGGHSRASGLHEAVAAALVAADQRGNLEAVATAAEVANQRWLMMVGWNKKEQHPPRLHPECGQTLSEI
jgi:hypothetical protein